jgi:septum site-determining protein MinD
MLSVVGGKGGCGKTTTAVGLGRAFAARGERVLLVEGDCDTPNLHTVTRTPYAPGVGVACADTPVERAIHRSRAYPGVDVLPAGSRTGAVPPGVLERARGYPGRVVIDCPAGATSAVTAPTAAADAAVVVSTPRIESQRDAAKTVRMARSLDTPPLGAVLTRAPPGVSPVEGPLVDECDLLGAVPRAEGSPLADPVVRSAYGRLAENLAERNP